MSDRLLGIGRRKRRHHRDLIGLEQPLDLDRIEPLAAVGERRGNDCPGGIDIGRELAGHRRRDLRQLRHHLAMPDQIHEAAHRVVFGGIVRNSGAAQQIDDLLVGADPDREHRLGRALVQLAILADQAGHGGGDIAGRSDRGLDIHHQDRVIARVGQQHLERRRIARGVGVADDVDRIRSGPGRRQHRVELLARLGHDRRGNSAQFDKPIDRENADAAAIGQDRQPLSRRLLDTPERLGAVEQFAKIRHPQHSGAAERGVIDRVRAGQRAGMGRGRLRALRHASGFDDDDGLDPCGGARRGHELAGVLDRFDIEQDRPRLAVHREVVKQIGDIDVELVADRNDAGETDRALRRPIHHAGGDRARLRDQRQVSGTWHVGGEAGVEICAGHHDAKTIRSDQPHSIFVRGTLGGFRQRARAVAEPGGDDERARARPALPPARQDPESWPPAP